jgi:hypothetical protein
MIRNIAAAAIIAGVSFLAGCAVPQQSSNYTPYPPGGADEMTGQDQFCGALGSCTPDSDAPYAMRGNVGSY